MLWLLFKVSNLHRKLYCDQQTVWRHVKKTEKCTEYLCTFSEGDVDLFKDLMSIFKLFYLSIKKKNKNHKEWSAECLRKKTKKQKTNQNKTGYLSEMTKGKETLKLQNITTQEFISL